MKSLYLNRSRARTSTHLRSGFTLVEIMVAMVIFTTVIAALFSTVFAALKIYYVNSDYLEMTGQTRRLLDDMIETGTLADDLAIFNDMNDKVGVAAGARGDFLMFFNRSAEGKEGYIDNFTCYYLARTLPTADKTGTISLWKSVGIRPTGSNPKAPPTADPKVALTTYPQTNVKRVSSTVLVDTLPRTGSPRPGIFTNDGSQLQGARPTVLVNLPASMIARTPYLSAGSNVTVAICPRH